MLLDQIQACQTQTFRLEREVKGNIDTMNCTRVEQYEDFTAANFHDPIWTVIGCVPTNQRSRSRHTSAYFEVFAEVQLKGVKAELN